MNKDYNEPSNKVYKMYDKARSWITAMLGVIVMVIGVAAVFLIASLEGSQEVKANNRDTSQLVQTWRKNNETKFPEEKVDLIDYEGEKYYFVVEERDPITGEPTEWYFAYDGGIEYVFEDTKFYVLAGITLMIAIFVSYINYVSTVRSAQQGENFKKTLIYYKQKKEKIGGYTQYISDFCIDKNHELYESEKRNIIEEAEISYDYYKSDDFDEDKLEKWQKKKLKKIKKIKIKRIRSYDLLHEHGSNRTSRVSLLPMGEDEHRRRFLIFGSIQKLFSVALNGMVVSFGVILTNWFLGIAYGVVVFISFITSIVIAADFTNTTLRNRYIGKANLLTEFNNVKEKYKNASEANEKSARIFSQKKEEGDSHEKEEDKKEDILEENNTNNYSILPKKI